MSDEALTGIASDINEKWAARAALGDRLELVRNFLHVHNQDASSIDDVAEWVLDLESRVKELEAERTAPKCDASGLDGSRCVLLEHDGHTSHQPGRPCPNVARVASLVQTEADLQGQLAERAEDTARLEWLMNEGCGVMSEFERTTWTAWNHYSGVLVERADTFRAAIDAAMCTCELLRGDDAPPPEEHCPLHGVDSARHTEPKSEVENG